MLANFSNLITFSRGSNATVTDASGRLTYAPHNLVTFSEQFDDGAWAKTSVTATANTTTAPNGTLTADTFTDDATNGPHISIESVAPVVAGQTYTLSIYAKASTASVIQITGRVSTMGSSVWANFNLATGAVGSIGVSTTASIVSVGNGWYRCIVTGVATGSGTGAMALILTNNDANAGRQPSYAGTGTSVFIWGAQVELGTTATTYNSTTVKNLLGFSEAFDNAAWSKTNTAVVVGAAQNPINNLWNAQKLMATANTAAHSATQDVTINNTFPFTFSVYVKAAEYSTGAIVMTGLTSPFPEIRANFNLANGTVTTAGSTVTASSITLIGNGWYRVSLSGYTGQSGLHRFYIHPNTNASFAGDGNSGIYIYGAQLSNSGSLDPYVPTPGAAPSSTAYYGPRFDYDPVTLAAKGILIEEQRTNLAIYSEQFDNAAWATLGGALVVTPNTAVAPDGTSTADTITLSSSFKVQQIAATAGVVYTFSVWLRSATASNYTIQLSEVNGSGSLLVTVTPTWQRFTLTFTKSAGASAYPGLDQRSGGASTSGAIYAWGAQLEAGAFATSYIPTVASQVTRTADVASITGSLFSQWYNQGEGTLVFNVVAASGLRGGSQGLFSVNNGTTSNVMNAARTNTRVARFNGTGSPDGDVSSVGTINDLATGKIAFTYKVNDWALSLNGAAAVTDATATVPLVTRFGIGSLDGLFDANAMWGGHIQNITYYPTRLTNDQLQAITK